MWVGPAVDLLNVTAGYQNEPGVSTLFTSIYGQLGYKWVFGQKIGFVLSPYINLGYSMGSITVLDNTLSANGFLFGLGLAIGVAF